MDAIPEKVVPKYGICIKRTVAKIYPTEDFASNNPSELFCNDLHGFVEKKRKNLAGQYDVFPVERLLRTEDLMGPIVCSFLLTNAGFTY